MTRLYKAYNTRTKLVYYEAHSKLGGAGANDISALDLKDVPTFPIENGGTLSIQVRVDDGSGTANGPGGAPTSLPQGTWKLYAANFDAAFSPVDAADSLLTDLAPAGDNAVIDLMISITDVPGTQIKLKYVPDGGSPGGGGDEFVYVTLSAW